MVRIYDCFLFFNELDLLEIRLNELSAVVDNFVLAEADRTFTGLPKPFHFEENKARFAAHLHKICHIKFTHQAEGETAWTRQYRQRDSLEKGIADARAQDLVLLSDIDEIPSGQALQALKQTPPGPDEVVCLELSMFYYFVNLQAEQPWLRSSPRCVRRDLHVGMQALRNVRAPHPHFVRDLIRAYRARREFGRWVRRPIIRNAGWHFSYAGGVEAIRAKVAALSGGSRIAVKLGTPAQIRARIADRRHPFDDRAGSLLLRSLDATFPPFIRENRSRFKHLIADELLLTELRNHDFK